MKYRLLILSFFLSVICHCQQAFLWVKNDSTFAAWVVNPGDTVFIHLPNETPIPLAFFHSKVVVVPINANASANLILTDQPNSEQPLANSQRSAVRINTEGYTRFRTTAIVLTGSVSVNNPRIYLQYSTDGVNWTGDGTAGNISLSSAGAKETGWITIPTGAIGDIYVRAAMNGGNGTADPALGNITIQLK